MKAAFGPLFRGIACLCLGCLFCSAPSHAQPGFNLATEPKKLFNIFRELYGPAGLIVNSSAALPGGDTHSAHFNSSFQDSFGQFGGALAFNLASLPLPSPASSFTYEFDPELGVFSRTSDSFGPILAQPAAFHGCGSSP